MDMIEQTGTTDTPETEKKYQPSGWLNNYARLPASPCNQRFLPSYFFWLSSWDCRFGPVFGRPL